jgi:isopenicillin N synthase-like dioxygenase
MLRYLDEIRLLGQQLLPIVADAANMPTGYFNNSADDQRYLLMKLIYYWPQSQNQTLRNGVAAHCDWSWITILLQDDAGLQIQSRDRRWMDVPLIPDSFVVNLGELVQLVTGGYFVATPHRVVNSSSDRPRVSIPVFINPGLDELVTPAARAESHPESLTEDHIHRVIDPAANTEAFIFGDSEWQRKGLGRWCYNSDCCDH